MRGECKSARGVLLTPAGLVLLMPTEMFEPGPAGMEADERRRHEAYRWWAIDEIARSPESFISRGLAELLTALRRSGPPAAPLLNEAARSRGAR